MRVPSLIAAISTICLVILIEKCAGREEELDFDMLPEEEATSDEDLPSPTHYLDVADAKNSAERKEIERKKRVMDMLSKKSGEFFGRPRARRYPRDLEGLGQLYTRYKDSTLQIGRR